MVLCKKESYLKERQSKLGKYTRSKWREAKVNVTYNIIVYLDERMIIKINICQTQVYRFKSCRKLRSFNHKLKPKNESERFFEENKKAQSKQIFL